MNVELTGAEIFVEFLIGYKTDTILGYPGSCVMLILDRLYGSTQINHVLVRHEQGAVYAACGYAGLSDKPGIVLVTSGPGATNTVAGIADAMVRGIPLIVITGQVFSDLLGTDAFQEVDIIGITSSITKWNFQIRSADQVARALECAFHVAISDRPGPVVLDFTKDAQSGVAVYNPSERGVNGQFYLNRNEFYANYLFGNNNDKVCQIIKMLKDKVRDVVLIVDVHVSNQTAYYMPGFGLPSAIGAKYACPEKTVCLLVGSREFQATIKELGIIKEKGLDIKIFLIHDCSNVKFKMLNPDFIQLVQAYNISGSTLWEVSGLDAATEIALHSVGSYFLEIKL